MKEVGLEHIALLRREKVDGIPKTFPATVTTLKSKSLYHHLFWGGDQLGNG